VGRGFRDCGVDGEFDCMVCLDRALAVTRARRGLGGGPAGRAWHGSGSGSGDAVDGTNARRAGNKAGWFHSLDLACATGSSATSGLWTSGSVLYCSQKPHDERVSLLSQQYRFSVPLVRLNGRKVWKAIR